MNDISFNIKVGSEYETQKKVLPEDSAKKYDSGLIDVFSTPALVALMESTAYRCVQSYLPEGYSTVGIEINIQHLKATPIGKNVRCLAKLVNIEGKKLTFEVMAWDETDLIGKGTHKRYIVNEQKFLEKIFQK